MLPALHLAGVHSVGNGLLRRAVQAGGRFGGGSRGECWLVCLLTFLFYVCQVYCWLVEESRGGYLYLVSGDETGNDRAFGTRG